MWVFETDEFKADVLRFGLQVQAENNRRRLEAARTRAEAVAIAGKYYNDLLIDKAGNFRLIGSIEGLDNRETVFVWLRVVERGGHEYSNFGDFAPSLLQSVNHDEIREWLKQQLEHQSEMSKPRPLAEDLVGWLSPITSIGGGLDDSYMTILEGPQWMQQISELDRVHWPELYGALDELVETCGLDESHRVGETDILRRNPGEAGLEFYRPDARTIFLLQIVDGPASTLARDRASIDWSREQCEQEARRAYPAWILGDRDTWFAIEGQDDANLSLSPEERRLLQRISGDGYQTPSIPLFVNGPAGSGKSTMLAYIFAGMLRQRLLQNLGGHPFFITYSDALLSKARQTTERLLRFDANFSIEGHEPEDLGRYFVDWRSFLISRVLEADTERFSLERRIDFHSFKQAWLGQDGPLPRFQGQRRWSAELVWFVIRSLIKGSDSVDDLAPEDYTELVRADRTVSPETFSDIYEHVYGWYSGALEDRDLWDDQDLVRAVLEASTSDVNDINAAGNWQQVGVDSGIERPAGVDQRVVALVVDEAQDFTRRELRLLTRLLAFADYELPEHGQMWHLPIVLAGDPMQTLSPTGFDWKRIGAALYEEFDLLFGGRARRPEFEVLRYNYRSSEPIVALANAVQLWRARLFGLSSVRAQRTWSPVVALRHPEKFILNQVSEEDFVLFARDSIIIIPCEEGGEEEFIRNDPLLSRMLGEADNKSAEGFIYSSNGIKGLEFGKVILYKFGEHAPEIAWEEGFEEGRERNLTLEYFFNKLYVGVSRATDLLYIVDTEQGDQHLWKVFGAQERTSLVSNCPQPVREAFLPDGKSEDEIIDLLGFVEAGSELSDVREEDPRANAIKIREYGRETKNSLKMRQAAAYFRRAPNAQLEATECEAWALRYDNELAQAADVFESAHKYRESWACRWELSDWEGLLLIADQVRGFNAEQEFVVQYMATQELSVGDLERFVSELSELQIRPNRRSAQWRQLSERLAEVTLDDLDDQDNDVLEIIADGMEELVDLGFTAQVPLVAHAYLALSRPVDAQRVAERTGALGETLAMAIASSIGYPAGLGVLAKAGLNQRIVDLWEEHQRPSEKEWHDEVKSALEALDSHGELVRLHLDDGNPSAAKDVLLTACRNGARRNVDNVDTVAESLAANGDLEGALDLVDELFAIENLKMGGLKKVDLFEKSLLAWALAQEDIRWPEVRENERAKLVKCGEDLSDLLMQGKDRQRPLPERLVPALGALWEVSGALDKAHDLYLRFGGRAARNPELRRYCRERYFVVTKLQSEGADLSSERRSVLLNDRRKQAQEWSMSSLKPSSEHPRASLSRSKTGSEVSIVPTGTYASVKWEVRQQPTGSTLELTDAIEQAWLIRLTLPDLRQEISVGPSVLVSGPDVCHVSVGESIVASVHKAAEVTLEVQGAGSQESFVIYRTGVKSRRTAEGQKQPRQKRTSRKRQPIRAGVSLAPGEEPQPDQESAPEFRPRPIRAYKLATLLDVTLDEVQATALALGIRVRAGDSKYSAEDVQRIYEVLRSQQ